MDEQILVVKDSEVAHSLSGEGFLWGEANALATLLSRAMFCPRQEAEGNSLLRQLIPYVVLVREGQAFTVTRTKGQTEARLHNKLSIGLGGHLNEFDVFAGAAREINEELVIKSEETLSPVFLGFINDLSTPVSRDHLGILFVCQVLCDVKVRELDKMSGEFCSLAFLRENVGLLEGWSDIALRVLAEQGYLF